MSDTFWVRVSAGGRIVIPASIRKRMDILPGDDLVLRGLSDRSFELELCGSAELDAAFKPVRDEVRRLGIMRRDLERALAEVQEEMSRQRCHGSEKGCAR